MKAKKMAPPPAAGGPRLFYSPDGTPIRVCLKDGSVAIVGETPRELQPRFWSAAARSGCFTVGGVTPEQVAVPKLRAEDDPEARRDAVLNAMRELLQYQLARESGAAARIEFENALIGPEGNERPSVKWLENRLGFDVDGEERDRLWRQVVDEMSEESDSDDEDEA